MQKNVRLVSLCAFQLLISVVLNSVPQELNGQDCVDYDIASYPKTIGGISYPWNGAAWNFTGITQARVSGLNIGGTGYFQGLLEHLPASYVPSNTSTKYPVIIFFHGFGSKGTGTAAELCKLFKDKGTDLATHLAIPGRIEREPALFNPTVGGISYEYIVISPQFTKYVRPVDESQPYDFPSADAVSDVIDYVVANYNVDQSRIYLTGLSNGANMIMEYAASSVARAQRVAAIMPVSLCSTTSSLRNTERGYIPANIATAGLPVWFVQCDIDNPCTVAPPQGWYNAIMASPGHVNPRFTILSNSLPDPLYQCSDTLLHDAWSRAYNSAFTKSFVNGNGANDGINQNMYSWFVTQTNAALPVTLKSFTAKFVNDRVELKWITTYEKNNASFIIERSGEDQLFAPIYTVAGDENHKGEKEYNYTDTKPLQGLGFYRLVQVDQDGKKTYFDTRKVLNQIVTHSSVAVYPNPVRTDILAYISVDRSQKVIISLVDMSGKVMRTVNGVYAKGASEVKIKSLDLPKGIYLLKISGENFSASKKIIKN